MNNKKLYEINDLLDKEFSLLKNNGNRRFSQQLKITDLRNIINDIDSLIHALYQIDFTEAGKRCRKQYIPLLNIAMDKDSTSAYQQAEYLNKLKEATRISARSNFEDFVRYYEWNEKDKFFEPRYSVLSAYAYYLNRMVFDENFNLLIVNLPSRNRKDLFGEIIRGF